MSPEVAWAGLLDTGEHTRLPRLLRPERMADEPEKNALHFCYAHNIWEGLYYAPVEHTRWNVLITALFREARPQVPEDDAFVMGETVLYIWHIAAIITIHM